MRTSHAEIERMALDQLEPQLVRQGYRLVRNPSKADLPAFVEGYVPDAIAIGKDPKIALEIKGQGSEAAEGKVARIRQLFQEQGDWIFQVYYFSSTEPVVMTLPRDTLDEQMTKISQLAETHVQAAFILAWSVLEAAVREAGLIDHLPGTSNRLISLLASEGYISGSSVSEFLELANLRNRIVHGQLDTEPSRANVRAVLDLVAVVRAPEDGGLQN